MSPDRLRAFLSQDFARNIRLVVLVACDSGNTGGFGNQVGAVAQAAHQAGMPSVLGSRFPLSIRGSIRMTEAFYEKLLGGPSSLEEAFLSARAGLLRASSGLDWASLQLYARPEDDDTDGDGSSVADTLPVVFRPYRGLLAFHATHARFFFGRTEDRGEILGDLRALGESGKPRFLVVAGASGTGKSSMVLAGAIPDLIRDQDDASSAQPWQIEIMRPAGDPRGGLGRVLERRGDPEQPFLLVVDQFEELFTLTDDPEVRTAFMRRLWSLAGQDDGFHCIATLRVDFLGRCGEIVVDDIEQWTAQPLLGHKEAVVSAAFSPDGTSVVTASYDHTARVWRRSQDGQWTSQPLLGHKGNVNSAAFSPDGTAVVTASGDNTARVWFLDKKTLIPRLWRATPDCLSAEERRALLGETPDIASANEIACRKCVAWYRKPGAELPCPDRAHAE